MPFSRFEKLAPEKRERLLDVAAQEFANRGFEQASLNRILEQAQMGKGSAYYYFEDKADVFCTVVQYASEVLCLSSLEVEGSSLTAENFWPLLAEQRRIPLLRSFERPWLFRVINVVAQIPPAMIERDPLASLVGQVRGHVMELIKRGQEIGVIRTDVPVDLLLAWLLALDQASDGWLMSQWKHLDRDAIVQGSDQTVAAISRALAPEGSSKEKCTSQS
jgi:AcrR family transcriptional regulator